MQQIGPAIQKLNIAGRTQLHAYRNAPNTGIHVKSSSLPSPWQPLSCGVTEQPVHRDSHGMFD